MYDNSQQRSAVLPLVLSTVGVALAGMVVRRIRGDRAVARGEIPPCSGRRPRRSAGRGEIRAERHGTGPAGPRTRRGPVL